MGWSVIKWGGGGLFSMKKLIGGVVINRNGHEKYLKIEV